MKNSYRFIYLLLVAVIFFSCNKEEPRPNYFYKFKVNGVQKEFSASTNSNIVYIDDVNTGVQISFFTMVTGNDASKNTMVISLRTAGPLAIGDTYRMQDEIIVQGTRSPSLAFVYFDETGKEYGATLLQSTNPGAGDNGSLRLTSFDTNGSYGTFEAVIFPIAGTGNLADRIPVQITEGEFFLPNFVSNR
jgi:hypothetical protein